MVGREAQAQRAAQHGPALAGTRGGADRVAKGGAAANQRVDRGRLPAAAHGPQAASPQLQIAAGRELALQQRFAAGADADLGRGAAAGVGAADRTLQGQVDGADRQVAGSLDAAAGAVEGEAALAAAQADRCGGIATDQGAVDPQVVGAAQADAAAGGRAADAGGAADLEAAAAGQHGAVAGADADVVGGLQGALEPQRAARPQGQITAGAAHDHIALDQSVFTGVKADRAVDRLQHAAGIDLHVATIGAAAAAQVDAAVGPHLASDVELAVGAAGATNRDR